MFLSTEELISQNDLTPYIFNKTDRLSDRYYESKNANNEKYLSIPLYHYFNTIYYNCDISVDGVQLHPTKFALASSFDI